MSAAAIGSRTARVGIGLLTPTRRTLVLSINYVARVVALNATSLTRVGPRALAHHHSVH